MNIKLSRSLNLVSKVDIPFIYNNAIIYVLILLRTNFLVFVSSLFNIKINLLEKKCILIYFYNVVFMKNEFGIGKYNIRIFNHFLLLEGFYILDSLSLY